MSTEIAKVRVCLGGEASVGKTSLVRRNKADLAPASVAGALLASRWRTSAKTGMNVEAAFRDLAERIVRGTARREDGEGPEVPEGRPIAEGGP